MIVSIVAEDYKDPLWVANIEVVYWLNIWGYMGECRLRVACMATLLQYGKVANDVNLNSHVNEQCASAEV